MTLARKIYYSMETGREYDINELFCHIDSESRKVWFDQMDGKRISADDREWHDALGRDHNAAVIDAIEKMWKLGYIRCVVRTTPERREWMPDRWSYYGSKSWISRKAGWYTEPEEQHFYLIRTK